MAGILAAAIAVGIYYGRHGQSELQVQKTKLRAQGEKLTLAEVLPGRVATGPSRIKDLVRLVRELEVAGAPPYSIVAMTHEAGGTVRPTWQLPAPQDWRSKAPRFPAMPTGRANLWQDLSLQVSAAEPALKDLREFLKVPDRDFAWNYDYVSQTPPDYHHVQKRLAAQWLSSVVTSQLHDSRLTDAQENLRGLISLARWHSEEWMLTSQMVRLAVANMALQATWAALQAPGWSEPQLAEFQAAFESLPTAPGFTRVIEVERAQIESVFDAMNRSGAEVFDKVFAGGGSSGAADRFRYAAWRAVMAERDELFFLRESQHSLAAMRGFARDKSWASTRLAFEEQQRRFTAEFAGMRGQMLMVSGMMIPNLEKAFTTVARYETRRELTVAAIALRRHQLRHRKSPASLGSLVPELLTSVPVDYMDGKPLRYRLNADGTFVLYSVGLDGKDDGGNPAPVTTGKPFDDIFDGRDAVWPQPTNNAPAKVTPAAK